MSLRLKEKVAIITGAGRGMGEAGARLFAKEGGKLALPDYRLETVEKLASEINDAGGEAMAIKTNVTDRAGVQRMAAAAVERFGRIDVLWNNVGGLGWKPAAADQWDIQGGDILSVDDEEWSWMHDLNARSGYLCSQAVIPHMVRQHSGSLIFSSSAPALTGRSSASHAYLIAKGAVLTMSKLIAATWGKDGIRSNVILPGITDSHTNAQVEEAARRATALGRIGSVDEVATVALFFASDESSFVSGESILVDGGAAINHSS